MSVRVREVHCSSAEELLNLLRLYHNVWNGARFGEIAFRGQAVASWRLEPNAFRKTTRLGYRGRMDLGPCRDYEEQCSLEYKAVSDFLWLADRVGLRVPGDGAIFRSYERLRSVLAESFQSHTWPTPEVWQTLAIAQHHGVPTRLLDFTSNPLIAAFFAAEGALRESSKSECDEDGEFAVWGVDLRLVRGVAAYDPEQARVHEVTVPRAENAFLHAQHGLFLVDTGASKQWGKGNPPPIEQVLCESATYWGGRLGVWPDEKTPKCCEEPVTKILAPWHCAADTLEMLDLEGITLAHIKPTYDGVVEALERFRDIGSTPGKL